MADYQQIRNAMTGGMSDAVLRVADQAFIPNDPANRDRQMYEEWLSAGNEPDPPDEPSTVGFSAAGPSEVDYRALVERIEACEARLAALEDQ